MISVDAVSVEFNGSALFSDITFNINENDRIALMGKNGAGKSTLFKIIAGVNKPTRGKVSAPKDAVIAYLPQHLLTEDDAHRIRRGIESLLEDPRYEKADGRPEPSARNTYGL